VVVDEGTIGPLGAVVRWKRKAYTVHLELPGV
jgi:hypothetical protein